MYEYLRQFAAVLNERQMEKALFDSAIKSVSANIKRGEKAMNTALTNKTTVHRAMYLQGDDDFAGGWVDFVWGDVGRVRPNGKTKGAMGIAHIIEARMRKDGMSHEEVVKMLTVQIPRVIARGRIKEYVSFGNVESVKVDYLGHRVGIRRTKGSNAWMVTAFELR